MIRIISKIPTLRDFEEGAYGVKNTYFINQGDVQVLFMLDESVSNSRIEISCEIRNDYYGCARRISDPPKTRVQANASDDQIVTMIKSMFVPAFKCYVQLFWELSDKHASTKIEIHNTFKSMNELGILESHDFKHPDGTFFYPYYTFECNSESRVQGGIINENGVSLNLVGLAFDETTAIFDIVKSKQRLTENSAT